MLPYRQQANKEEILITANIITDLHSTQIATIWGLRLTNSVIAILPALSFLDFFVEGPRADNSELMIGTIWWTQGQPWRLRCKWLMGLVGVAVINSNKKL